MTHTPAATDVDTLAACILAGWPIFTPGDTAPDTAPDARAVVECLDCGVLFATAAPDATPECEGCEALRAYARRFGCDCGRCHRCC